MLLRASAGHENHGERDWSMGWVEGQKAGTKEQRQPQEVPKVSHWCFL